MFQLFLLLFLGVLNLFVSTIIGLFAFMCQGIMAVVNSIIALVSGHRLQKVNQAKRGVTEYQSCKIGEFFPPNSPATNVVISGGDDEIRSQTINAIATACPNNIPIVVLHQANNKLESMFQSTFVNSKRLTIINNNNPHYDPFAGLSDYEISRLVIESAPKDFDIKPNAQYYIDGMIAYIKAINKKPSLNMFATCPHSDLFDKVDGLVAKVAITDTKRQDIKNRLMQGQSERYKLENYFLSLKDQFANILSTKATQDPKSIARTIDESGVILIGITSNVNKLMLNVMITQIRFAISKGKCVSFIADELSTKNNELFSNLIEMPDVHCKLTVCSSDVFAMCGGEEKIFNTILGNIKNSGKIVIYAHTPGASANKWADAIGHYDKIETSTSNTTGSSRQSPFQLFPGSSTTNTINRNIKREHIIKPEEINRMQHNEVYIFDRSKQKLVHTWLD